MSLRNAPLDELVIPDGTTAEEHDLVTDRDVIVGGRSTVEFGVRGQSVLAGEGAEFGGDIEAEGDCRLDMWSDVAGNVLVGGDAYLGERAHVGGQLKVAGDLDIGDDVDIDEGFEANGWIVIRNPMPTVVFLFVYLSHLLRAGEEDAAEEFVEEVVDEPDEDEKTDPGEPLTIPRGGRVGDESWQVSTPARIGNGCRLHGNVRAESIDVGERNNVFGSLRARGDITIGTGTLIHGDVTTRNGTVRIEDGARIRGDVSCSDLWVNSGAIVDGTMRASGEVHVERSGVAVTDTEGTENEEGVENDERAENEEKVGDDERRKEGERAKDGEHARSESAEEGESDDDGGAERERNADREKVSSEPEAAEREEISSEPEAAEREETADTDRTDSEDRDPAVETDASSEESTQDRTSNAGEE